VLLKPAPPMIVRDADFAADLPSIRRVRTIVFIDEQHVPSNLEWDDRDAVCRHVLALDGATAVGTGRLDIEYGGKIGRIAVLASHRRSGAGTLLMERLHAIARDARLPHVWCHAQVSAAPFYERVGYRVTSPQFLEADIAHVRMERVFV
jgi:predicted GNAT family N-acyltransferase